jgi:uncharacterized LabA/DUF88 family protein
MAERVVFFVDGENLVCRYQDMLRAYEPHANVIHEPDVYVWNPQIIQRRTPQDIHRVIYYTSAVAADETIKNFIDAIKRFPYTYCVREHVESGLTRPIQRDGHVFPRVFKKARKEQKVRAVDINIAVDMLSYASLSNVDAVCLISGDGDFIPLIEAVLRKGKRVYVSALSSGLNPELPRHVDEYTCLDERLFRGQLKMSGTGTGGVSP